MKTIQVKVSDTIYEQIKRMTDSNSGAKGVDKIIKAYVLGDFIAATRARYEKK